VNASSAASRMARRRAPLVFAGAAGGAALAGAGVPGSAALAGALTVTRTIF
jgi:hypothetical protein